MDIREVITRLMSRIRGLDPESATEMICYMLIVEPGHNEMMRLANGSDDLLLSFINQGKAYANRIWNQFPQTSPRISIPNNNATNFPSNSPRPVPCDVILNSSGSRNEFSHGDFDGFEAYVREELMRMKQRLALMPDDEFVRFLDENQRNVFLQMQLSDDAEKHSSRQIYFTFPRDSIFNEEDVSAYFSTFGPVSNVRIPFQEKRMFGFVTFVYPETVKHIFEIPDLHYVCGYSVRVKRYKNRKQLMEEGEYPATDSRELLNIPIGPRLLLKNQKMMLREKLEHEVVLQHGLELQRCRMMNLQQMGLRNEHHNIHHNLPFQPVRLPISSPRQPRFVMIQNVSSDATNQEILQDGQRASYSPAVAFDSSIYNHIDSGNKQRHLNDDNSDIPD